MEIYTLGMMQPDINQFFDNLGGTQEPYYGLFICQYLYGLRFNEVQKAINWERLSPHVYKVQLSKGQSFRTIDSNPPATYPLDGFLPAFDYFVFANNTTASILFNRHFPKKLFLDTGKSITSHFFRHFKVKELISQGQTINQIAALFGEINPNNIAGYANSVIQF